jgi:hypothetical protein
LKALSNSPALSKADLNRMDRIDRKKKEGRRMNDE